MDVIGILNYSYWDWSSDSTKSIRKMYIYINDGNEKFSLYKEENIGSPNSWVKIPNSLTFLDLNSDGITDRLNLTGSYINDYFTPPSKIYLSNGKGGWDSPITLPLYSSKENLKFIDVNGDGNIDIYQVKDGADDIWINNGTGHFSKSSHHPDVQSNEKNTKFADLNADGFVDIYEVKNGDDNIWLNNGRGIFTKSSEHPNVDVKAELLALADMNGDGLTDIVPLKNGASIYTSQMKRPVITAFTDSFSNKTNIEYKLLTDEEHGFYTKDADVHKRRYYKLGATAVTTAGKGEVNIQNASLVVSDITTEKGSTREAKQSYTYKGLKYHKKYGSLGFREVTVKDNYGGEVVTRYYQEFPFVGSVKNSEVLMDGLTLSKSSSNLDFISKNKQYIIKTKSTTEESYDNGALVSTTTTNYNSYDDYGNVLEMTTTTSGNSDSFTKTTTNQYDNNEQNWILGRLKESSVKHAGWGTPITRHSSFTYNSKGSLETETIEKGNQSVTSTKTYVYDKYGNRKKVTLSAPSLTKDRVTEYTYDASGKNLLKTKNALGHTQKENNEYNNLGQLTKSTNANGQWISVEYDKWGKKTKESSSNGTSTSYAYAYSSENGAKYKVTVTPSSSPATTTYYDKFDRVILVKSKRFDGEEVSVETIYNAKGEVEKKSLPHTDSETVKYIVYSYDEQGRPIETEKPSPRNDESTVTESIEYDGLTVTVTFPGTNGAEHTKTTTKNVLGEVVKIEQEKGAYVEYTYDATGNLKTTIPNGNEAYKISMTYDILGNKKSMKDPDMGSWTYTYDALGQLKTQTDAKKQVTSIEYDQLGRKTSETNVDGTNTWVYDTAPNGLGKLASESGNGIRKVYSYNSNGKLQDVKTDIYNKSFKQSYAYDAKGRLETTTQPNGFKLINTYNAQGYLESIKSPVGQIKNSDVATSTCTESLSATELIDASASWRAFGKIWDNQTYTRTYKGEQYTYVPTITAGSGAYQTVATEVGKTYSVSVELVGADVNRNEDFSTSTYLSVGSTVPIKGVPVVGTAGVLALVHKTGGSKETKTFTFVAKSTTSYISVRSDTSWKYANARALSVKEYGSGCNDESTDTQEESTTNDNEGCEPSTSTELIDASASWRAFGKIWDNQTYTRTYKGEQYTYVPTITAGSGAYQTVATEVGKTYSVSVELVGADVNRNEEFIGNSYVTVSSSIPKRDESGVIETSGKVTGSTKVTKTFTFIATSSISYVAVRSDQSWQYANARALSVKEVVSCKEGAVANTTAKGDEQSSDAYQKILSDAEYIYHYKVLEQTSLGQVTKYLSGNGLVTEDAYNSAGTMTSSKTGYLGDDGVRDLTYEYYDNYSLSKRVDKKLGLEQDYIYDALDRIKISTVDGSSIYGSKAFSYNYDVYGNIKKKTGIEGTFEYFEGTHQVKKAGAKEYSYDPNGNMLKNGDSTIEYNAINKATKLKTKDTTLTFTYDMNGNRFQKSEKFTDTYYIGKGYEFTEDGNQNQTHKYLIYANGKVVTVHTEATSGAYQIGEKHSIHNTQYLHYDSLGSVDTITNQQGLVVERMAYKPFGEQIDLTKIGESITNRGYTGHEHIKGTDFIHMNARLYDPTIGRFLSADTIIQAPYDSQSYNRYSYVRNNPLKYTDPTGHIFGIGSWVKKNWRTVVTVVVVVAVTYFTAGMGTTAAMSAMIQGASAGFAGGFVGTALNGGSFGDAMLGGVIGGLIGGVTAGFAYNIGTIGQTIGGSAGFATRVALHGGLSSFMSKAQGGRWSSGFWSGAVGTSLAPLAKTGNYYGNVASNAIIGGTISRVTGGKFANGAAMGAFRYMFNEWTHPEKDKYGQPNYNVSEKMTGKESPRREYNGFDFFDMGAGVGGGVHLGIAGINAHYDAVNETCNACVRIGPGAYIGGGIEYYGYANYGKISDDFYYTGGLGADVMMGDVGAGGGINGNFDTLAGTGGTRYGLGLGGSAGLDLCVNW